jgi:hypothetical protein
MMKLQFFFAEVGFDLRDFCARAQRRQVAPVGAITAHALGARDSADRATQLC